MAQLAVPEVVIKVGDNSVPPQSITRKEFAFETPAEPRACSDNSLAELAYPLTRPTNGAMRLVFAYPLDAVEGFA
jgi:hypothetical protein